MGKNQNASTWREWLAECIRDVHERERLAAAISIQPITLKRWAEGISQPREQNISSLLRALPFAQAQIFLRLALVDFPDLLPEERRVSQMSEEVPVRFYAQLMEAHAKIPLPMGRQALQDLLFQQMIQQLDPEQCGMSISLEVCVRPLEGHVVRSLREIGGIGTPPWPPDLGQKTILLGAESLSGYALTNFRRVVVPNRAAETRFPVHWTEHEQSVVALPIARRGLLCGCVLVASVVPDYFLEDSVPVRLLENYAFLASLIFEPHEFYPLDRIRLSFMPPYDEQVFYFQHYNRFIQQQFRLAQVRGEHCTLEQARHQVWREIEEKLIQDSAGSKSALRFEEENV